MNWRPDNWKNLHTKMVGKNFVDLADAYFRQISDSQYAAYEAGADAILEALKQKGLHGEFTSVDWTGLVDGPCGRGFELPTRSRPKKGTLIIIPDEEESSAPQS